jgi:hypothetical protein
MPGSPEQRRLPSGDLGLLHLACSVTRSAYNNLTSGAECLLPRRRRPEAHDPAGGVLRRRRERRTCGRSSRTTRRCGPPQWSHHPLPRRNTPSGGENHLTGRERLARVRRPRRRRNISALRQLGPGRCSAPHGPNSAARFREPGRIGGSVGRLGFSGCCTAGRRRAHRARIVVNSHVSLRTPAPYECVMRAESDGGSTLTSLRRWR